MGRARHALSDEEQLTIENMMGTPRRLKHGEQMFDAGDYLNVSTMLVEGVLVRTIERSGRRHIVAIHLPGDFVDLHAFPLKRLDHSVCAIGPAKVAQVTHERLNQLMDEQPHLARMLWFSTLLDAAIHREWILTMEHLPIEGRLAHLLAELWHRFEFVDLADNDGFNLPLTQVEIAQACGTTAVHLNRVVRSLRESGIAELTRGRVTILDRTKLEQAGEFEPSYLYGQGMLRLRSDPDS